MILFHRPGIGGNIPSGRTIVKRAVSGPGGSVTGSSPTSKRRRKARPFRPAQLPPLAMVPLLGQEYDGRPGRAKMTAMVTGVSATHATATVTTWAGEFPIVIPGQVYTFPEFNALFH